MGSSIEEELTGVAHAWDRAMVTNDPEAIGPSLFQREREINHYTNRWRYLRLHFTLESTRRRTSTCSYRHTNTKPGAVATG